MSLLSFRIQKQSCHGRAPMVWIFLIGICAALWLSLPACAEESLQPVVAGSQISAIDVSGNTVRITASSPIKHSVVASADPFKVLLVLENMGGAQFTAPLRPEKSIVSEILLAQTTVPQGATQISFSLASPAQMKVEGKGTVLEVVFEETVQVAKASQASEVATAPKPAAISSATVAREITDILLEKTEQGAELVIKTDSRVSAPTVYEADGSLYIDVPVVIMKGKIPSKMVAPIRSLKYRLEQDRVRFIVEPTVAVESQVTILDDELVIDIKQASVAKKKAAISDMSQQIAPEIKKKTLSLDFQDADIVPIFRLLSDVSGHNILVHPDVKGRITMKLNNAPWDTALDYVLKTFSLHKLVEGNTIRVMTSKAYQDERKAVSESRELAGRAEDIDTKIIVVNYAEAEKVKDLIDKTKVLSPRGSVSVDARTRSVIVKDIASVHEEVRKLVSVVDKQTPQVLIEARIVEVSTSFSKSLGVDWGLTARPRMGASNWTGTGGIDTLLPGARSYLLSPTGVNSATGATYQAPLNDYSANYYHPTGVNLPATTTKIVDPTSALTLGFLNASQTFGLDLRLSAIETAGKAKTLASPKILTFENQQALIKHGKKIPISTPTATQGTYTTTYIDANLKLTVTPQIAPDNSVSLKVEVNKDEPDYLNKDILGNPAIDTRTVQTQVLIKDGETLVIGGIIKSTESNDESAVPGLSKIPLLGLLFKRTTKEVGTEEMMVFITPRIVRR